jgi:hypothetical protein
MKSVWQSGSSSVRRGLLKCENDWFF